MTTQQLQYFNTIATLENMSKAAELLHVSQSNLSKVLSKLEEEIGCALFERNGKDLFVNTRDLHRQMIAGGLACGFVPSGASSIYENDKNIKLVPIAGGSFQRPVKMAFKREKHLSPLAIEFKDFLINYFNIKTN